MPFKIKTEHFFLCSNSLFLFIRCWRMHLCLVPMCGCRVRRCRHTHTHIHTQYTSGKENSERTGSWTILSSQVSGKPLCFSSKEEWNHICHRTHSCVWPAKTTLSEFLRSTAVFSGSDYKNSLQGSYTSSKVKFKHFLSIFKGPFKAFQASYRFGKLYI